MGVAQGINIALNIKVEIIAEWLDSSRIIFNASRPLIGKMLGKIAKYLEISFVIENVVSAPFVIRSCLQTFTISIILVGSESRSIMFEASFAATVPVFMANATSACANAGPSFVPPPYIATIIPFD